MYDLLFDLYVIFAFNYVISAFIYVMYDLLFDLYVISAFIYVWILLIIVCLLECFM